MAEIALARLLTVAVVLCAVTPFTGLLLFMRWQSVKGGKAPRRTPPIERTQHGQTVTLRGQTLAIDVIRRPSNAVRSGVQIVIDDDSRGRGVRTRLHVYGAAEWQELKRLIEAAEREL